MTQTRSTQTGIGLALLIALVWPAPDAHAKLSKGQPAPEFELPCTDGKRIDAKSFTASPMSVVIFLGLDSKTSRELTVALGGSVGRNADAGLRAIGIARADEAALASFATQNKLPFPLCSDPNGEVLAAYGAGQVLPMTYIVGPDGRVAKRIAGGGGGAQQVLLAVAEKEFARGRMKVAESFYADVLEEDSSNTTARAGRGYALAGQGKLDQAQNEFDTLAGASSDGARLSKTGLADVALQRGDLETAARNAEAAGDDAYAEVIRGRIAARRGKPDEAAQHFEAASGKKSEFEWQPAMALNDLARVTQERGDEAKAIGLYDKAIAKEPLLTEARSNKGVALERTGKPIEARRVMATARTLAPNNQLVTTLLRRLEQREKDSADVERGKRADALVSDLAKAYRSGTLPPPPDEWTPRAVVVSFIGLEDQLGPQSPAGLVEAFQANLTLELQKTGRFRVVDREMIDKLLAELKLGSSALADPATRLRLGRVLAASVLGTGGFYPAGGASDLKLRLVDTETTDIREILSAKLSSPRQIETFTKGVAAQIATKLAAAYPLRGKVADVDGSEILISIGKKQGAASGMKFKVVEEGKPVEIDGQVLGRRKKTIGTIEVTDVQDGFSAARKLQGGPFRKGHLLMEGS